MITFIENAKTVRLLATTDSRTRGDRKRERRAMLIDLMRSKGLWKDERIVHAEPEITGTSFWEGMAIGLGMLASIAVVVYLIVKLVSLIGG